MAGNGHKSGTIKGKGRPKGAQSRATKTRNLIEKYTGKTPLEVYHHLAPANAARRFEPREKWPTRRQRVAPGPRTAFVVSYYEGRRQLPVFELRQAA